MNSLRLSSDWTIKKIRSAAGELGSVLGILNIKIPDMLSHKRCHGDSGILGCAEYELKMSNNDKKVSGRRLVKISFCSSCTSEAPQKMELGLAQ